MTDREKFIERWSYGGYRPEAVYTETKDGCSVCASIFWTESDGGHGVHVRKMDTLSDTPAEAWAKADAVMVARFGEPPNPARDALVLKADAAMRKWQARAKEVDLPRWTIDLMGLLCSWRATVLDADVEVYADTWPEAVLQCDALAEPIWQARESK